MTKPPIFIHSLFRSGSTYFFKVFRRSPEKYYCFQEALHESVFYEKDTPLNLLQLNDANKAKYLRHPNLGKPYYEELVRIWPIWKDKINIKSVYSGYFGDKTVDSGVDYFTTLINEASKIGQPVFQECRTAGRIGLLKSSLGGIHIYLWRNPWDQWWSYKVDEYFDFVNQKIIKAPNNLYAVTKLSKYINKEQGPNRGAFTAEESYLVFYFLWVLGLNQGIKHADVLINIDKLSKSDEYKKEITTSLSKLGLNQIDFSDCNLQPGYYTQDDQDFFHPLEKKIACWLKDRDISLEQFNEILRIRNIQGSSKLGTKDIDSENTIFTIKQQLKKLRKSYRHTETNRANDQNKYFEDKISKDQKIQALQSDLNAKNEHINTFKSAIAAKDEQINTLHTEIAAKDEQINTLQSDEAAKKEENQELRKQLQQKTMEYNTTSFELAEIKRSKSWKLAIFLRRVRHKLAPPDSLLAKILRKLKVFIKPTFLKIRRWWHYLKHRNIVKNSELFDKDWYLSTYQDVAQANIDPLRHYLLHGGFEGRDPSENFNSSVYLNAHVDVHKSGLNPLLHFLLFGNIEGRISSPKDPFTYNNNKNSLESHIKNDQFISGQKIIHYSGNKLKRKFENKNVAVIAPISPGKTYAGAERFYEGLSTAMQEKGCNVDLILKEFDESSFAAIKRGYSEFADLNLDQYDLVISTKAPSFMISHSNHILYLVHTIRVFYDMFEETFPNADSKQIKQRNWIHEQDTNAISKIKSRFSIGNEVSHRLEKWNNYDAEVLHPGINRTDYYDYGNGNYLLIPGRLHQWKRVDLAIKAVKQTSIPIRLLITGVGEAEKDLQKIAGGDKRIEFLGRVSKEKLKELYANALAVLFFPIREDYGYVTIEAFASGKPVVTCTDSGEPTKFVIDGETGFVCPPNPANISDAIEKLWNNPHLAYEMGKTAREIIKDLQWSSVSEQLLQAGFPETPTSNRKKTNLKIAVLDMQPITPAVGGGRIRLLGLYHALGRDITARYVGTYDWPDATFRRHFINQTLEEITIPLSHEHHTLAREASKKADNKTVIDLIFGQQAHLSPNYLIETLAAINWADIVIFSHPWVFPLVKNYSLNQKLIVYDSQNVEYSLRRKLLNLENPFEKEILNYVFNTEKVLGDSADIILTCSKEDVDEFVDLYNWSPQKLSVMPNGVFISKIFPATGKEKRKLQSRYGIDRNKKVAFFIGSNYQPNVEAANFIIDELVPKLKNIMFVIAGGVGNHLKYSPKKNLIVTGFLESAQKDDWLRLSDFAINPMMSGSGTNLKMFEFMAAGLPIISTAIGARGITNKSNNGIKINELDNFGDHISNLLANQKNLEQAAQFNREFVINHFSWEEISPQLGTLLKRAWLHKTGNEIIDGNKFHKPKSLAHLTTLGIKCGIGEYTKKIIEEFNKFEYNNYVLNCETPSEIPEITEIVTDSKIGWFYDNNHWAHSYIKPNVVDFLKENEASNIIIQYHPGFFSPNQLEEFVIKCIKEKISPIIIVHNFTQDCIETFRLFNEYRIPIFSHSEKEVIEARKSYVFLDQLPFGIERFNFQNKDILNRDWKEKPPLIITNGFLRKHKGARHLIDAMPIILEEFPGARLIIQTSLYPSEDSTEEYQACISKINQLGLENNVSIDTRFLPKYSLLQKLNETDVAVFPYDHSEEGGSGSASDAIAAGLPLIVSKANIFNEIRHITINSEPEGRALAIKIINLLKSPDIYQKYAEMSANYAIENSWSNVASIILGAIHMNRNNN